MKYSKCKGCGREIVWARTPAGKNIPLERVSAVYTLDWGVTGWAAVPRELVEEAYVSHFVKCPARDQFSKTERADVVAAEAE